MNVAELIRKLEQLPQDAVVYRYNDGHEGPVASLPKLEYCFLVAVTQPKDAVFLK